MNRLWRSLPYDGQGLLSPAGDTLALTRHRAALSFWQRVPWWSRPLLITLARLAWIGASVNLGLRFGRIQNLPWAARLRVISGCLRSGARPNEAFIWREFFAPPELHPLPGRAAGILLSQLGDPGAHRLLADKHATAELLAGSGLPVPPLLAMIRPGESLDLASPVWSRPGYLFLKPRRGSAGRGAVAIEVLAGGFCRIDGGPAASLDSLLETLNAEEDLLLQPQLFAAPELGDLATGNAAPVLRMTTAREPGAAPFLHSAILSINVPGEWPRHFIRGQLRVPLEHATGVMRAGIWFLYPGTRYTSLPWSRAPVAARSLPGFDRAVRAVLDAMALLPGLALVNWDVIMTSSGPVILEGNTGGDWILTNVPTMDGVETVPLAPLLNRWGLAG